MSVVLSMFLAALVGGPETSSASVRLTEDTAAALAKEAYPDPFLGARNFPSLPLTFPVEYLPQVSVSMVQNEDVSQGGPDSRDLRWGVSVQQLLFDAGRGARTRDLAHQRVLLEKLGRQALVDGAQAEARTLFRRVLVLRSQEETLRRVADLAGEYVVLAKKQHEWGLVREIDVLETETKKNSLEMDLNQASLTLESALFDLKNLLGLDPAVSLVPEGTFDFGYTGYQLPTDSRWLDRALASDLNLREADLLRRQQGWERLESNLRWVPDILLEAGWSVSGKSYPLQNPVWEATVSFQFPWDGWTFGHSTGLVVSDRNWTPSTSTVLGFRPGEAPFRGQTESGEGLGKKLRGERTASYYELLGTYRLSVERLALQRKELFLMEKKKSLLTRQVDLGESTWLDALGAEIQLAKDQTSLGESIVALREIEGVLERWFQIPMGTLGAVASQTGEP